MSGLFDEWDQELGLDAPDMPQTSGSGGGLFDQWDSEFGIDAAGMNTGLPSRVEREPEVSPEMQSAMQGAEEKGELSMGEAVGGGFVEGGKDVIRSHASSWLGTMRGWQKGVVDSLREDGYADEDIAAYMQGGELPDRETDGIVDWVRERFQQLGVPRSMRQYAETQEQRTLEHSALADPRMQRDLEFELRKERTGGVTGFAADVARVAPQLGGMVAANVAGGPILSGLNIMSNITGMDYERHLAEGVDPHKAFNAAFWDATMQAPLEQIGVGKIANSLRGVIGKKLRKIAEAGLTEGLTEYLQAYPEKFTELFAKDPDAQSLTEVNGFVDAVIEGQFQKDALYQGAVGAVAGGGMTTAGIGVNSTVDLLTGKQEAHPTADPDSVEPVAEWEEVDPLELTNTLELPPGAIPQQTEQTGYGPIPQEPVRSSAMEMPEGGPAPAALPQAPNTYEPIELGQHSDPIAARSSQDFEMVENEGENYRPDFEMVQGGVPAVRQTSAMEPYTLAAQANEAATSMENDRPQPTEGQKEAGNYRKGHVKAMGLDISIENPSGSERSGTDKDGKPWSVQMPHHYGYIKGTKGKDKDHLDVFIKDGAEQYDIESKPVFVVDQVNKDGSFDEHKILMGFDDAKDAEAGYFSSYEQGWQGMGAITEMSADEFKTWSKKPRKTKKPVALVEKAEAEDTASFESEIKRKGAASYGQKSYSIQEHGDGRFAVQITKDGERSFLDGRHASIADAVQEAVDHVRSETSEGERKDGEVEKESPEVEARKQPLYALWEELTGGGENRDYIAWARRQDREYKAETDDAPAVSQDYRYSNGYSGRLLSWIRKRHEAKAKPGAESVFNRDPEVALNDLTDAQLDEVGKRLGKWRGKKSKIGFIESIMGGGIAPAREAFLSVMEPKPSWQISSLEYAKSQVDAKVAERMTGPGDMFKAQHKVEVEAAKNRGEEVPVHVLEEHGLTDTESVPVWEPEWTELDGQKILRIPGSKWAAVPNNGKKISKAWTAFNVDTREEGPQLKQSEVRKWLADAANGEDVEKNSAVEVKKLPEKKPKPKIKTPQVEPVKTEKQEPEPKEQGGYSLPPGDFTQEDFRPFTKALGDGEVSADVFKAAYDKIVASEEAFKGSLSKLTKKQILAFVSSLRYSMRDSKADLIRAAYDGALYRFSLGKPVSFTVVGSAKDARAKAMREMVEATTDEDLQKYAEDYQKRFEEYKAQAEGQKKALENPETYDEFRFFVDHRGEDKLTPEQKIKWDELQAEKIGKRKEQQAEQEATVKAVKSEGVTLEYRGQTTHTKKGHDLFVVGMAERVDRPVFNELKGKAKQLGGYWSSYRAQGAIPGFQFTTKEAADKFMALQDGDVSKADAVEAKEEAAQDSAVSKLREMADNIEEKANESLNQDRKTHTARYARMASGAEADARANLRLASTMRNIAEAIESGAAKMLSGIKSKVQIETLDGLASRAKWDYGRDSGMRYEESKETPPTPEHMSAAKLPGLDVDVREIYSLANDLDKIKGGKRLALQLRSRAKRAKGKTSYHEGSYDFSNEDYLLRDAFKKGAGDGWRLQDRIKERDRLARMGITTEAELRVALREFLTYRGEKLKADPVKEVERSLAGRKIDGYFPTPKVTVEKMLAEADIESGMSVLEPSAGKGNIADIIKEEHPNAEIEAVEPVPELRSILEAKGYSIVGRDFLEHDGEYDRIVMNPPFEKRQDVAHVRHAFELLKPGGRIVAIMSEGPFFGQDKTATEFRGWLDEVGWSEKLPEGSFKSSERPTGVATRMVVIDKPENSGSIKPETAVESISDKEPENSNERLPRKRVGEDRREAPGASEQRGLEQSELSDRGTGSREGVEKAEGGFGREPSRAIQGETVAIASADGETKARYEVRESSDLVPSHDPVRNFIKHPDYPDDVQERPYHSDGDEQTKVKSNAARLDPRFVLSDNPDAINGPPVVTANGIGLGGNSRIMSIQLAYDSHPERADKYREELKRKADYFGIDPAEIDAFDAPVLVRVVDGDMSGKDMARAARMYNQAFTQGLDSKAEGVSKGRLVSDSTVQMLANILDQYGSLREYLNTPGSKKFVQALQDDGVLEANQMNRLTNKESKLLNEDGKRIVEQALRGRVIPDFDLLDAAPASLLQKIDRVIPAMVKVQARGMEWDITPKLNDALRQIVKMKAQGLNHLNQYFGTASLMPETEDKSKGDEDVQTLAYALQDMKPLEFKRAWDAYAKAATGTSKGQGLLPGVDTPTPESAMSEFKPGIKFSLASSAPIRGVKAKIVQAAVSKLQAKAKKALPIKVVQSFDDLPRYIRDAANRAGSGLIEAANDGRTVYMVADNIASRDRAVALWLHEQGVHTGLKEMFGPKEYKTILNQVYLAAGGKKAFANIAKQYGLDLNTAQGRQTAAEEHLAKLAEKVSENEALAYKEASVWRRLVRAFKSWLNKLGLRTRLSERDIAWIVKDAIRTTVHGGGPGGGVGPSPAADFALNNNIVPIHKSSGRMRVVMHNKTSTRLSVDAWLRPDGLVEIDNTIFSPGDYAYYDDERGKYIKTPTQKMVKDAQEGSKQFISQIIEASKKINRAVKDLPRKSVSLEKMFSQKPIEGRYKDVPKHLLIHIKEIDILYPDHSVESIRKHVVEKKLQERAFLVGGYIHRDGTSLSTKNIDAIRAYKNRGGRVGKSLLETMNGGVNFSLADDGSRRVSPQEAIRALRNAQRGTDPNARAARHVNARPSQVVEDVVNGEADDFINNINSGDMSWLQEVASLPHWIAKRFPAFDAIYRRQLSRMDERASLLRESLEEVEDFFEDMTADERAELRDIVWEIDGEKLPGMDMNKFIPVEDENGNVVEEGGRAVLEMNPEYYEAFDAWLNGQNLSTNVKRALRALRKSLDNDFLRAYDTMRKMAEIDDDTIKQFRSNINHIHNYFPHKRYGAYYVQAVGDNYVEETDGGRWAVFNASGEIISDEFREQSAANKFLNKNKRSAIYREHFDALTKGRATKEAAKKIAALKAEYDAPGVEWSSGKNDKLPDELYEFGIDTNAMEQIVNAAADKLEDQGQAQEIKRKLAEAVSDTLKSRGWSASTIKRKGIPGHELDDIQGIVYDYKAGLTGWMTKIEASRDFTKLLGDVNAKKHPREYVYATNYIQNMLRNSDKIDRAVGNIKALAFLWYLGFNLKTAALNLTQNLLVGIPRLGMDVKGGSQKYFKGAMDTLTEQVTGRVTGREVQTLADDEMQLLNDLYREDVITEGFLNEIRGKVQGFSVATIGNKVLKYAGMPMAIAERFNRASLALAAYRAARDGKITNQEVMTRYGLQVGDTMTYDQAKDYAEDIVRDAHFVYGKTNLPQPLRNSSLGRGANPAYTFRTFTHNILSVWNWMLQEQGTRGKIAFAKSMVATMTVGGFTALPFYATLMHLYQWLFDDDDDWTEEIRKALPENDMVRDIVSYGLPAGAGFSLGGSVGIETPIISRVEPGATIEESLANNLGDILGIPYDMFIRKPSRITTALKAGNTWRAFEEAAPTIVRNGMAGFRMWQEGQTSMSGKPINEPGKAGPRKLTGIEAAGKIAGFQPISSRKSYDKYRARNVSKQVRSNQATELANRYVRALRKDDADTMASIVSEWKSWNKDAKGDKKLWMVITKKDLTSRIKSRMKAKGVSKREALRFLEQEKAY
jgi:inorganic pyrophosphatase